MNRYERFEHLRSQPRESTLNLLSAVLLHAKGLFEVLLKSAFEEDV